MKDVSPTPLAFPHALSDLQKARKSPRQARSAATVEAILSATIQLLTREEHGHVTTTRVAERAGVSIGTIYQYFPHKRALLFAVLKSHLDEIVASVEAVSNNSSGYKLKIISDRLVSAFLEIRINNIAASRAIYLLASDLDTAALLADVLCRLRNAVAIALSAATDANFEDIDVVSSMICATLSGTTRTVLEREDSEALEVIALQLPVLCRAYLEAVAVR